MSITLKMNSARLAVGYAKDGYWLASDLPATICGQKFSSARNHCYSENVILYLCLLSFATVPSRRGELWWA